MIEKYGDKYGERYKIQCDFCNNSEGYFEEFQKAMKFRNDRGWRCERIGGLWFLLCPECRRKRGESRNVYS